MAERIIADETSQTSHRRVVYGLALALALSVFPLIWVGGLVTTYDAGMEVPDWPNTYGWNMWAYPIETWLFGPFDLLAEHSHRLLGTIAGFLAIGLVIVAWIYDSRKWFRWWTVFVLLSVIAQGALGGMRVLLDARTLAMIHGCTGPLFFAMTAATATMCSRFWFSDATLQSRSSTSGLRWIATLTAIFSFIQLTIGAQLRHVTGDVSPKLFTMFVHSHLTLAGLLVILVFLNCIYAWRGCSPELRRFAAALLLLVLAQVALGIATWLVNYALPWSELNQELARYTILAKGYWESVIVTAHVATGSLIICFSTVAALVAWRLPAAANAKRPEENGLWKKQLA